jgi:hypothetical protein
MGDCSNNESVRLAQPLDHGAREEAKMNPSVDDVAAVAAQNEKVAQQTIAQLTALITDKWTYRIVVLSLGIAVMIGMIGLIVLSWRGVTVLPEGLVAIASAAVGALAGLLAPSPKNPQQNQ